MPKTKKTKEEFIKDSIKIHGDKYDYSLVEYINSKTKVKIICKEHGVFEQRPNNHLGGQNCYNCGSEIRNDKLRYNIDTFIEKSNSIHNNLYDYSLVKYISSKIKVDIICKIHGIFKQSPHSHLSGSGCSKCAVSTQNENSKKRTKDNIIERFIDIHGDKYNYSNVTYIDAKTKIKIICKKHGSFYQMPHNHLEGQCCPKCMTSKGVNKICRILENKNINYELEKKIKGCVSDKKYPLKFDIYIPDYNIYIEFDGEQHFNPYEAFGGLLYFEKMIKNDKIKDNFCKNNNLELFRISYKDNIEEKLNLLLNIISSR